ncbi:predicted protein [Aspergillus terreus NIH2624]|uniref:Trichodiene synthase n=1 Tax=Aspergillus terreus (strain NIH 2624 / FGSC A1156) TaxID=341663 RepID=Q0CSM5_ASPTN|nr:uncharacterized protein ATEG_03309 [Aspergillus terreus NIH2624]EAU36583.1 predicted protein [Aspergillus terreus NIH2624]
MSICTGSSVSRKDFEDLINGFIKSISYRRPEVHGSVIALKDATEAGLLATARIQMVVKTGVAISSCAYSHTSREVQEAIAEYTVLLTAVDDLAVNMSEDLRTFASKILLGQPLEHELLCSMKIWMESKRLLFGEFAGDMLVKNTLDFMSINNFEANIEKTDILRGSSCAPETAEYLRGKSGASENYALFIFPEDQFPEDRYLESYFPAIPYFIQYASLVNDVISFYKEEQQHERNNFIHIYARSHSISPLEALMETRRRAVEAYHHAAGILSEDGDKRLLEAGLSFLHGYVTFHFCTPRYRLETLDIPAVKEDMEFVLGSGTPQADVCRNWFEDGPQNGVKV